MASYPPLSFSSPPCPTTNGGVQNISSVGIHTRCMHFFARLAPICMLGRCLLAKFLHRSSVGSLLRVCCWLGPHRDEVSNSCRRRQEENSSSGATGGEGFAKLTKNRSGGGEREREREINKFKLTTSHFPEDFHPRGGWKNVGERRKPIKFH